MTKPSLEPGRRRNRIRIEREVGQVGSDGKPVRDPAGQQVKHWVEVTRAWANIAFQGGLSAVHAQAQTEVGRASIRLPFRADIEDGMRVIHKETIYAIRAVLPDVARRRHVDLVCEVING